MERPLNILVLDFETSDLVENNGKIIEVGATQMKLITNAEGEPQLILEDECWYSERYPLPEGEKIAIAAKATHGIWENELPAYGTPFNQLDAQQYLQCEPSTTRQFDYVVAHNAEFEQTMLLKYGFDIQGKWICTMKVARRVYPSSESFDLQYLRYHAELENSLRDPRCDPPHAAGPDTWATALLLEKMHNQHHVSLDEMVMFTSAPTYYHTCPLGKHKGKPWHEIDSGYLAWILKTNDMDEGIKHAARQELNFRRKF